MSTDASRAKPQSAKRNRFRTTVLCILALGFLLSGAAVFVRNARREAYASQRAWAFRDVLTNMRSFSDVSEGLLDGDRAGPMKDSLDDNGERMLSWRVWLTYHSLPLP